MPQVLRRNSQRPGLYISDFQTADKAVVEELKLLEGESLVELVVAVSVAPGANMGTDRLSLPRMDAVKVEEAAIGENFRACIVSTLPAPSYREPVMHVPGRSAPSTSRATQHWALFFLGRKVQLVFCLM
jgi:hypothetical protein